MNFWKLSLLLASICIAKATPVNDVEESEISEEEPIESININYVDLDLTEPRNSIPLDKDGKNCPICAFHYPSILTLEGDVYYHFRNDVFITINYATDDYTLPEYAVEHRDGGCLMYRHVPSVGYGWCCDIDILDSIREVNLIDCHGDEIVLNKVTNEVRYKESGEKIPPPDFDALAKEYVRIEEEPTPTDI